jgi:hypothetical protein
MVFNNQDSIKNEDGYLSGILGVSHDITDQVLVKKNLEIAKKRQSLPTMQKAVSFQTCRMSENAHERCYRNG